MSKEKSVAEFKGTNGSMILYTNRVSIKKNALGSSLKSLGNQKEIYIQQIVGVEIKKPGLQTGYVAIKTSEDIRVRKAIQDENAVAIGPFGMGSAKEFKAAVDKAVSLAYQSAPTPQHDDSAEQIAKYKQLLDSGAITQEEYDSKKKQLLNI